MKTLLANPWLLLGLRLVLGVIFLDAGLWKLRDPQAFAGNIAAFQLLPPAPVIALALALPWLEILVGILLVGGWAPRLAAFSLLALSVIFAGALGQALARGLEIDCGCFGPGRQTAADLWLALGRNALIFLAAGALYRRAVRKKPTA